MLFDFLFSDSNSSQNDSIMTEHARLFVDKIILENDIRFMKNILHYYFSTRDANESLIQCIGNTTQNDALVISACEYFEIIPPISQNVEDFSLALVTFINYVFSQEQIKAFIVKEAMIYVVNLN